MLDCVPVRAWLWMVILALHAGCGDNGSVRADGEAIRYEPASGAFGVPFELSVSTTLPGASLHYTLDGSLPTADSPTLDGTLFIDRTTQLRAIAIVPGTVADAGRTKVVNAHYFRLNADVTEFSSNLPLVVVHMLGSRAPAADARQFQRASMQVFEPAQGRTGLLGPASFDSRIGIKVRGRSTRSEPKHSFSIELWDELDQEDDAHPLLGMPAHADWALYAPYNHDRSFMRNALMYALSQDAGRYAARTRFVELFLVEGDGEVTNAGYLGVHALMERIKRGPQRVPVERLRASDLLEPAITGGYIVKVDETGPDESGFRAAGLDMAHVYPKEENITTAQADYLGDYFEQVARALEAADGKDPETGTHYEQLIDVGSFIDHHILNAYAKNPDALRLSAYFHKPRGAPLRAGPAWDFDRTMGSNDPRDDNPMGWSATGDGTHLFEYPLWRDLFEQADIRQAYAERFRQLLAGPLSTDNVHARIDDFATGLGEAAVRDTDRWPDGAPQGGDFQNEVDILKDWTRDRAIWIGGNLDALMD